MREVLVDTDIGEGRRCGSIADPHLMLITAAPCGANIHQPRLALLGHHLPDTALGANTNLGGVEFEGFVFGLAPRCPLPLPTIGHATDRSSTGARVVRLAGRRNITLAARCELAQKLAEVLRPKARENQKGGQRGVLLSSKLTEATPIDVREQAAAEAGVSAGSMSAFKFLQENAEPEELEALKRVTA